MQDDDPKRTIPLLEEQLHVSKANVITDEFRVTTSVQERAVLIEEDVERGDLRVERIAVERAVSEVPEPRQDGDTLIVSIVEERVVVEKRLFVVEEVRITRRMTIEHVTIPATVRTMRATVEHVQPSSITGRETDG